MSRETSINDCKIIELGKIHNRSGNITVIDNLDIVPFNVKRTYYLYDIPGGAERGGHAHKYLKQLIVAASGSFSVELFDGSKRQTFSLNHPNIGLFICPGIWRELKYFSSGSISLVLASELYNESDYLRDINEYIRYKHD